MGDIASQSRWSINSPTQGAKKLTRLKSYDVGDEASVEAANAVGSDDPVGFIDKPGAKTISFTYYSEKPKPEVDWRRLQASKEQFNLTQEIVGGERLQYTPCRVSSVSREGDDEGSHMITVEIIALRCVTL
jgi:hypothetical protein